MAAKKTAHRVAATMIVVKVPGAQGGEVYLRRGRVLPESVEGDEVKRLVGLGLVEKFDIEPDGQDDAADAAAAAKAKAEADAKAKAEADAKAKADAEAAKAASGQK